MEAKGIGGKPGILIHALNKVDVGKGGSRQKPYCLASSVRGTYRTPYIFFLVTLPCASLSICQMSLRRGRKIRQMRSANQCGYARRARRDLLLSCLWVFYGYEESAGPGKLRFQRGQDAGWGCGADVDCIIRLPSGPTFSCYEDRESQFEMRSLQDTVPLVFSPRRPSPFTTSI